MDQEADADELEQQQQLEVVEEPQVRQGPQDERLG
jgi:hypothetical protein